MRSEFDIASSTGSYRVRIEDSAFDAAIAGPREQIFLADAYFTRRLREAGCDVISIDADEAAKSLDRMSEMIVALRERRANRATLLVAVGGGVVQDIAGFVASIYMRGLAWSYLPTSLLGMTDSCIGGKSSINVGGYKNLIGTFHPPVEIVVDPQLTLTLDEAQRAAGLIEAAKIAFCRSDTCFAAYRALEPSVASPPDQLGEVIDLSLRAKRWFVETDEFDRAERLLLNFGHTFGHAIESASDFAISHGIAVGLGMLAALAYRRSNAERAIALQAHVTDLLHAVPGLSATVGALEVDRLLEAFESDKKHSANAYRLVLVSASGVVERVAVPRTEPSRRTVGDAFAAMIDQVSGVARPDLAR